MPPCGLSTAVLDNGTKRKNGPASYSPAGPFLMVTSEGIRLTALSKLYQLIERSEHWPE